MIYVVYHDVCGIIKAVCYYETEAEAEEYVNTCQTKAKEMIHKYLNLADLELAKPININKPNTYNEALHNLFHLGDEFCHEFLNTFDTFPRWEVEDFCDLLRDRQLRTEMDTKTPLVGLYYYESVKSAKERR